MRKSSRCRQVQRQNKEKRIKDRLNRQIEMCPILYYPMLSPISRKAVVAAY